MGKTLSRIGPDDSPLPGLHHVRRPSHPVPALKHAKLDVDSSPAQGFELRYRAGPCVALASVAATRAPRGRTASAGRSVDPFVVRRQRQAPNCGAWPSCLGHSSLGAAGRTAGPPRAGTVIPAGRAMAVVVSGASAHSATRRTAGAGPRTRFATLLRHRRCYAPRRRATAAAGTAAPLPRRGHRCQQLDPGAFRCRAARRTTALG